MGGKFESLCQIAKNLMENDTASYCEPMNQPGYGLMDICEEDGCFTIYIDAPGIKKEDIHVTVRDNVMVVSASRSAEESDGSLYYSEMTQKSFSREVLLPSCTNVSAITSSYVNGVVTIRIEKNKPDSNDTIKRIPVQCLVYSKKQPYSASSTPFTSSSMMEFASSSCFSNSPIRALSALSLPPFCAVSSCSARTIISFFISSTSFANRIRSTPSLFLTPH